jgi:hypothetical protein
MKFEAAGAGSQLDPGKQRSTGQTPYPRNVDNIYRQIVSKDLSLFT